jgi:phosphoglycolate phosphatase
MKLIIFDLDGTLVNAYLAVSQSLNYTLKRLGHRKSSYVKIKRSVGWGDRNLMVQFFGERMADRALVVYRPHHFRALADKACVRLLPGAMDILKFFKKKGFKLAIASNRPSRYTAIILKTLGIRKFFNKVLCADQVQHGKPNPQLLLEIMKSLKVPKADTLYTGDMTIDIQTGRRAGVLTVAVATGSSSRKELKDLKPHQIIGRITMLKCVVQHIDRERRQ